MKAKKIKKITLELNDVEIEQLQAVLTFAKGIKPAEPATTKEAEEIKARNDFMTELHNILK